MIGRRVGLAAGLALALVGTGAAQPGSLLAQAGLGEPEAVHSEGFGLIAGVRELSDGRVLVADPMSQLFMALSPDLSTATPLGREGQGPGEFRQPDGVWPLGGDLSLLVDLGNARLTRVDASGKMGETTPILIPGARMTAAIPGGTDARGAIYFQESVMGPRGMRDSVRVMRRDLQSGDQTPVATVKAAEFDRRESGGDGEMNVQIIPIPMSAVDVWGTTPDGGIYVARAGASRMEFVTPDGEHRVGAPLSIPTVPIRGAEQEEWQANQERTGSVGMSVEEVNGQRRVSLARARRSAAMRDLPWPDAKPSFTGPVFVDPDGRGWVRRARPAGEPAWYDVFDQTGSHVGSVEFPEGRSLAGFGAESLYAARVDDLDLHHLERYSIPTPMR